MQIELNEKSLFVKWLMMTNPSLAREIRWSDGNLETDSCTLVGYAIKSLSISFVFLIVFMVMSNAFINVGIDFLYEGVKLENLSAINLFLAWGTGVIILTICAAILSTSIYLFVVGTEKIKDRMKYRMNDNESSGVGKTLNAWHNKMCVKVKIKR